MRIYKYPIPTPGKFIYEFTIEMPLGSQILHIGSVKKGNWYMWALIDNDAPMTTRTFVQCGTGAELPDTYTLVHLKSVIVYDFWVWHFFERTS